MVVTEMVIDIEKFLFTICLLEFLFLASAMKSNYDIYILIW